MFLLKNTIISVLILASSLQLYSNQRLEQIVGDYRGKWLTVSKNPHSQKQGNVVAQVFDIGMNQFRLRLIQEFDYRCEPIVEIDTTGNAPPLIFEKKGWRIKLSPNEIEGTNIEGKHLLKFELKKTIRLSPTLDLKAPKNAEVLFDGSDLHQWKAKDDDLPFLPWLISDEGSMHKSNRNKNTPQGARGNIVTKKGYRDCKLHIEFRYPWQPEKSGQAKGNSGVFLQNAYEVQILNTYGLPGYYNQCGAIYKEAAPMVNMASPSMQWQTYDIEYYGPRFNESGKKTKDPIITVVHNGVKIHNEQVITNRMNQVDSNDRLPIRLQDHGTIVEFRNIWIIDLENE